MFYRLLRIQQFFEAGYQSVVSLIRVLLRSHYRSALSRERKVRDELFVLGNGPGLKAHLDKYSPLLKSKELMCVNQFALTPFYTELKPAHYVLLDIGFFVDPTLPRMKENRERLEKVFREETDWPMTLYLPYEARKSQFIKTVLTTAKFVGIVFYNRTVADGLKPVRHWMYRKNLGMPPPQNVLIGALMVGLNLGYRKIIILGADHSWHLGLQVDREGMLNSAEQHFYDKKPSVVAVHHPETLDRTKIHDYFFNLYRTFRSYHLIRQFADHENVSMINASTVSYIDAFIRRRLSDYPWSEDQK
ncbi:MAG: hypothetical protein J7L89_01670 [Bacteroidales bacterium]|nr:hypothetical protein [Bacteroidales bacterium]